MTDSTPYHWQRGTHGELSYSRFTPSKQHGPRYGSNTTTSGIYGERAEQIQAGLIEAGIPGADLRPMADRDAVTLAVSGPLVAPPGNADEHRPGQGLFALGYGAFNRAPVAVCLEIAARLGARVYRSAAK